MQAIGSWIVAGEVGSCCSIYIIMLPKLFCGSLGPFCDFDSEPCHCGF